MKNIENTNYILNLDNVLVKIDYKDWLFNSRRLNYQIIMQGSEAGDFELKVRSLYYNGKVIAIESYYVMAEIIISLMIEEHKIIRGYQIKIDQELYTFFVKRVLKKGIDYLGTNNNDETKKSIIEFYNEIIEKGHIIPVNDGWCNMFNYNPWWFPKYTETINDKKVKYKMGDVFKLIDTKENKVTYGLLAYYNNKKYKDEIGFYKCDVIDTDNDMNNSCIKFFLLHDINYGNRYKVELVTEDELSVEQKSILKRFMGEINE